MGRWVPVFFLTAFMTINFADKAVFGLAAGPIVREFGLSPAQFGAIGSAFFLLFSVAALTVGWLGDRLNADRLIAGMAVLWGVAQLPIAAAVSLGTLIGMRVLLGASEGPAFPTALHVAFRGFSERERPLVSGLVLAGTPLGAALAAILCTWLIGRFGWHSTYGILGIVSIAWAIAWLVLRRGEARSAAPALAQRPAFVPPFALFANRTMIGAMLLTCFAYGATAISIIWLPLYFEGGIGLSPAMTGWALAAIWPLQIPMCFLAPWLVARLRRAGTSGSAYYGTLAAGATLVTGLSFIALSFATGAGGALAFAGLGLMALVIAYTLGGPIVAHIAPEGYRSSALGMVVAAYAVSGFVSPSVFGLLVQLGATPQAGYRLAFGVLGGMVAGAAIGAYALIRPDRDREYLLSIAAR